MLHICLRLFGLPVGGIGAEMCLMYTSWASLLLVGGVYKVMFLNIKLRRCFWSILSSRNSSVSHSPVFKVCSLKSRIRAFCSLSMEMSSG